jgi:flagellar motor component MotA
MIYPLSLVIAMASIWAAISHLKQSPSFYFDMVAMLIVFGGTFAVSLVTLPWRYKHELKLIVGSLLLRNSQNLNEVYRNSMSLMQASQENRMYDFKIDDNGIASKTLNDGAELILLGLSTVAVENILRERID